MNRSHSSQCNIREGALHVFLAVSMLVSLLVGLLPATTASAQVTDPSSANLTINKTVIGSAQTNFQIVVTGPSYPTGQTFDIVAGSTPITGLLSGVYTVTELSPGTGWTTTYQVGAVTTTDQAVVSLANASPVATFPAVDVTGRVYHDFNSDGLISTGAVDDRGAAGVTVDLIDTAGANVATTQTDANGFYTLTPTSDGPYRVEFSNLPTANEPSRHGAQNATSVQFVNSAAEASNVNFGIIEPCFYCQENPLLVTPVFQNGDPTLNGSTANSTVLSATRYSGVLGIPLARGSETGATWGVAYQRSSDTLLTSAYLKRHAGFAAGGISGIYKTENADTATPTASLYFKLSDLGINVGDELVARGLPNSVNTRNRDIEAFGLVGRRGIGDIDLSEEGSDLFVSNLFQGKVHRINLGNPAKATVTSSDVTGEWTIPSACSTADPSYIFGLKVYRGKVYVGAVCSAESTQVRSNLQAAVFEIDPTSNAITKVLEIPLGETRGRIRIGVEATSVWYPWKNTWSIGGINPPAPFPIGDIFRESTQYSTTLYYPQPMLSDIEFDVTGDMIVGIRDRFGDQSGYQNYAADLTDTRSYDGSSGGDILRARKCTAAAATWTLESAGGLCGAAGLPSQVNGQGPDGGEFYTGDFFKDIHEEASMGSLALLGGSGEVVMSMVDPVSSYTGGFNWLDNTDGSKRRTAQIYRSGRSNGFGKANGLGDIEVLCDPAPIEIGNRVWSDVNGNGIQDPGEPGLNGLTVTVTSAAGTSLINTSGDGNWYFAAAANTAYTITVASPAGFGLTTSNADGISSNQAISDVRDSDAGLVSGIATVYYTTGAPGQSNHGLDVGFAQGAAGIVNITNIAPVQIGNRLWIEDDNDGMASTGNVTPVVGQQVTATGSNGITYTATTDGNGLYTITVPANDTYTVTTGIPAGTVATPILATDGSDPVGDNDKNHDASGTPVAVTTTDNLSIDFGFFQPLPALTLRKYTNGYDADNATGPYLAPGSTVTWTYVISNIGNVTLNDVTLSDDKLPAQNPLASGVSLAPGEVMTVTRTGVAALGQYENTATVTGTNPANDNHILTATNPSHYFGAAPSIAVRKYTNGEDADEITGPQVPVGSVVTWTYIVTNTGNVVLTNVTLVDDKLAGTVAAGVTLQPGEVQTFTQTGIAQIGQYTNTATVEGTYTPPDSGQPDLPEFPAVPTTPQVVTDTNPSHYFGFIPPNPGLVLRKYTNGYDADSATGPYLNPGSTVTWTYIFINTGNVTLIDVTLSDDKLPAQNPLASGISLAPGEVMTVTRTGVASIGQYVNTATVTGTNPANDNQILTATNPSHYFGAAPSIAVRKYTNGEDADEITGPQVPVGSVVTWTYIVTNTGNVVLTNVTLVDDKLAGTVVTGVTLQPGEVQTFTQTGIAQIGQYTNTATVEGTYTPPDSGQPDLPGFPAVPTTPQVVTDTNPSHYFGVTQPANVQLGDFVWQDNNQDGIQDAGEAGVVGVTVTLQLPNGTILTTVTDAQGHYLFSNLAPNSTYTVTFIPPTGTIFTKQNTPGDDSKDSDANPTTGVVVVNIGTSDDLTIDAGIYPIAPPLLASLGNYVWNDTPDKLPNEQNDVQDSHDKGVANVKVELLDGNGTVISTTVTDGNGFYLFSNLEPGVYSLRFTAPTGFSFVKANQGSDDSIDSDVITANGETSQTTLTAGENDLTWDAGLLQTPTSDDEVDEPPTGKRLFLPLITR